MTNGRPTLCALLLFFVSQLAWAQTSVTDGVLLGAKSMFRDMEKNTVALKGDVQIVFKGQHLSCDKATMDMAKQLITAEGHVILTNATAHVEGDKIVFNYHNNTGFIYNGFVQSGQVVFEGELVEKTGENHYIATEAQYTACETCPPGWSFSGRKIDAEIGGYARIQRPVFRVGGVPILILPSLIVPLLSRRQSGFLVPSMDYSQLGGLALSAIYFWAIDRSQDMTLTARWYKNRGYQMLDDYRYVLSKDSKGELKGAWLEDQEFKNEFSIPSHSSVDRWFLNYDHYQVLPDNFVHRADLRLVSDLQYTRDFPDQILGQGDPALENKTSITKTTDNTYMSAEVDMYTNLLKFYPLQDNADSVNRFPEIKYSAKEQRIGGADWAPMIHADVDYVNFARQSWNYDNLTPCISSATQTCYTTINNTYQPLMPLGGIGPHGQVTRDGQFNPAQDLWRTGQRLDVQPTISYPFQIAHKFDILPSITYRETQYRFDSADVANDANGNPQFDPTAARRYVEGDIAVKTEFSHVYGDTVDPKGERWKHTIQPEIGYSQIPWKRDPNHPFFGQFIGLQSGRQYEPLSDADLGNPNTGVQFDYQDRTYERRVANYVFDNRLTHKVWNDGVSDYRTLVHFQVAQSYDFKEAERPSPGSHPWSSIDSLLDLHFQHVESYNTISYNPYASVSNISSRLRLLVTPKNFIEGTFAQSFILDDNDNITANSETRTIGMSTGFVTKYAELIGHMDFDEISHHLQDWGYEINLRPPGRCWVIHLSQMQILGGDAEFKASLNFDFGGETKSETTTRSQAI